jgi:hypothetical protein
MHFLWGQHNSGCNILDVEGSFLPRREKANLKVCKLTNYVQELNKKRVFFILPPVSPPPFSWLKL